MRGKVITLIVLLALAVVVWGASNFSSNDEVTLTGNTVSEINGERVPIKIQESSFEFVGGKVVGPAHPGTFENWEGYVYLNDRKEVVGIEGTAQVSSIKTDNQRVDSHLQTDDFFNAENYPQIKFTSTNVDLEAQEITGILEIKGMEKELTIPANFEKGKVSGEFSFDADEFFKYDILITEIEINFEFIY